MEISRVFEDLAIYCFITVCENIEDRLKKRRRFIFLCLGFVMVKRRLVLSVRDRGEVVA